VNKDDYFEFAFETFGLFSVKLITALRTYGQMDDNLYTLSLRPPRNDRSARGSL